MRAGLTIFCLLLAGGGTLVEAQARGTVDDDWTQQILAHTEHLRPQVLEMALDAYGEAHSSDLADRAKLTIIDYELPSYEKRLWVIDMSTRKLLFEEWVSHGMGNPSGSGGDMRRALSFSNRHGTRKSSLGLFRTAETYRGKHGYSLKLDGLEPGLNDLARERLIVMHSADYVSANRAKQRLVGRSWGCPAVRPEISRELIDSIKGGSLLWVYHPDPQLFERSTYLGREWLGIAERSGPTSPAAAGPAKK